jgi:protein MpaA
MHGNEPKSVYVCRRFIDLLQADPDVGAHVSWIIVPVVNPDGLERRKRKNARGVDLNRNFPTKNWELSRRPRSRMYGGSGPASEPETKAVIRAVERFQPAWIVTVHSIDRGRFCNNYDGPARKLAQKMARHNKYPVRASIGYPTPGSFGTWAGIERGIPTLTLELPSHHSSKRCWQYNRNALLCTL